MVGSVRPDAVLSSQTYLENSLGELLLSPSTVSVDLDEFDQVAKRVLGHRASDLEVLALCHQLVAMYGTGLAVLSLDDESIYVDTERRLKRTYLDALFEGAQTAVLLGSTKDALEFGQVALELDFTREDMCGVVMRALAMEGRFEEMRCVFSQCTQEVIATQGKPVSRELRALFAQLKEREEHVRVEAPAIEPAPKKKGRSTRGQKGTKLDVQAVRGDVDIVL
jgi:DNA-binding SARP family transcriptional activator